MNKISVISLDRKFRKFSKKIASTASKILKILRKNGMAAEIYLAGDREMKFLNRKFRGKNKAADVLSFEEPRGFVAPPSKFMKIGEIYLNMADNRRKAAGGSRKTLTINRALLIHGFLHLLGYDHKKKNDRIKMEKREKELILKL